MKEKRKSLLEINMWEKKSPQKEIVNSDYTKKNIRINPGRIVRSIYAEESASSNESETELREQRKMIKTQSEVLIVESGRKFKRVRN